VRFARDHRGERVQHVDITAMIDVVFLLIIFFMTTAQFARMTKAEVDLPREPGEERAEDAAAIIVNVTDDGSLVVDGVPIALEELRRKITVEIDRAGGDPGALRLTVRADRALPAAVLNDLARLFNELGLRGVRLATKRPGPQGGGS